MMGWIRRTARRGWCGGVLAVLLMASLGAGWAEPARIALVYSTEQQAELNAKQEDPLTLYRNAIEANGGAVVAIGQSDSVVSVREALASVHGVLLPGGIDVDPKFYDAEPHPKLEKTDADLDRLEFAILDYAVAHRLPVLGICRGHQLMNVCFGGTLIQDIPSECRAETSTIHRFSKGKPEERMHAITLAPDSLLHGLLGADTLPVTTYHHQAVLRLAPGFRATAHSEDGLIEAIEAEGNVFMLGVQFHPEKMLPFDSRFNALFARFIEVSSRVRLPR